MIKLFLVGILEIFLGVIDFKLTQRNRKIMSTITTMISVFIWYFVIQTIINDLNNIYLVASYALGCGIGCYLGLVLDTYIEKELFGRSYKSKILKRRKNIKRKG